MSCECVQAFKSGRGWSKDLSPKTGAAQRNRPYGPCILPVRASLQNRKEWVKGFVTKDRSGPKEPSPWPTLA